MDEEFIEIKANVKQLSSFEPEDIYDFIQEKLNEAIISESSDERF